MEKNKTKEQKKIWMMMSIIVVLVLIGGVFLVNNHLQKVYDEKRAEGMKFLQDQMTLYLQDEGFIPWNEEFSLYPIKNKNE